MRQSWFIGFSFLTAMGKSRLPKPLPSPPPVRHPLEVSKGKRARHPSSDSSHSAESSDPGPSPLPPPPKSALHRCKAQRFHESMDNSPADPTPALAHAPDHASNSASIPAINAASASASDIAADSATTATPPDAASDSAPFDTEGFSLVNRRRKRQPPRPTPRTQPLSRPMVSVAPPPPTTTNFPAFRIPAQPEFPTSYDAVAALEDEEPQLKTRNVIGKDGSSVLVPLDESSFAILEAMAADPGAAIQVIKLDPNTQTTKGVVMGYPLRLPLTILLRHPQVESAERCRSARHQEDTRQVLVTLRGPLTPSLTLGNWGTFYLRPYTPEPLRCYRCQKFGHHQANCFRQAVCGICSGKHSTDTCLSKYKAKEAVTHRCPNCGQAHHAWNRACPARLAQVTRGRERQVAWVQEQQRTATSPAPPGTFVWGQQNRARVTPPPPQLTPTDFPALRTTPVAPQAPPAQPPPMPTPDPQSPEAASAPTPQAAVEPVFTTVEMMEFGRELAKNIAECLVRMLGATIAPSTLEGNLGSVITETLATRVEKQTGGPRKTSQPENNQTRKMPTTHTRVQVQAPPTAVAVGLTPASLRIDQERKALGLSGDPRLQKQLTCPKGSPSFNGTA